MTVTRLQHIGIAVADFRDTCRRLEAYFGLHSRDFRDDQGKGMQHDSRVLFGNECWLHVVHNWNPESRVRRFLERHGPGLEHIALETNDIEADVERIRKAGAPIFEDTIFKANDGYEAFVYPDDAVGFTVELIQPHPYSWSYPSDVRGEPLSSRLGIVGLHHVGAIVDDLEAAAERLERLFGLTKTVDANGKMRAAGRACALGIPAGCA
ncbi:MAG: hypothetical protein FJW35_00195 [Acidobacteria bacterium]|nr:hypothetical protein [Acidobacteriota bacterium]